MSSSHIAVLSEDARVRVRSEVESVLGAHGATSGGGAIELPYTTDVYWVRYG